MKKQNEILKAFKTNGTLTESLFFKTLSRQGIQKDDLRLEDINKSISQLGKIRNGDRVISSKKLERILSEKQVVKNAVQGQNIIPDFDEFISEINEIYQKVKTIKTGEVASYIPQLGRIDPNLFSVSICTIDGQVFSIGDVKEKFSLQSSHKPINYALALEELGDEYVHHHVGKEPSGVSFNALSLNDKGLPHNPLINAGAIMCSSLIKKDLNASDKFDLILDVWHKLIGADKPTFNNSIYQSERTTADRNFALAYFMRENKAFPEGTNIQDVLEFYFQCCSIESNTEMLARVAATFANSGINPFTHDKVFEPETIKHCLSMMDTCGMYDYSGEFAFSVGIPAKSGVSGVMWMVIPNVMGISVYSPPLDQNGNSVRAIEFARELSSRFNFHNYDSLNFETANKKDPRRKKYETKTNELMTLIFAASAGDLDEIRRLHSIGVDLDEADYDGRTALHLASAENHEEVVKFLLDNGVNADPKDRWGGTPMSDAKRSKHTSVMHLLDQAKKS